MIELHGFQAAGASGAAQPAGGSSPGVLFKIQQYEDDMCLAEIEVSNSRSEFRQQPVPRGRRRA